MSLGPGTRFGSYEVVGALGSGGMGEVYRARDTRLDREVAIKVLPEAFAADAQRVARFEREAKVLASLNHPHIAQLYGLEQSGTQHALVMELVEGVTLAEQINQGSGIGDQGLVFSVARQIAAALEAAHDQGIVHRDLKPANIKIRPDGTVKVLDFGLAKMRDADASSPALTMSPTLSVQATVAGVILGTAAYMSPEQARGRPVDRRTDIWAFGCVLFEMLAGRQTFDAGETVSDAVAAILKNDPDWSALPADTPPNIRTLLKRCLQKDPQKRLPHIGLVRLELDEPSGESKDSPLPNPPQPRPLWKRALPAIAAALVAGLAVGGAMWTLRSKGPATSVMRFPFMLPEGQRFVEPYLPSVAISRDGTQMAYAANGRLFVRSMAELEARPVPGTESADVIYGSPVFSPDGQSLAFWSGPNPAKMTLKRIAVVGGTAVTLCEATYPFGSIWDDHGIAFGQGRLGGGGAVLVASPNGGQPMALVKLDKDTALGPQFLPGGEAVLVTVVAGIDGQQDLTRAKWDSAQIAVISLKSGQRKTLIQGGSDARYLPTGQVIYALGGTLFAVPFDIKRLEVAGPAVPVVEGVARTGLGGIVTGSAHYAVSAGGSLVYVPGPAGGAAPSATWTLALFDRKGTMTPLNVRPGSYEYPRVSPDGTRLAVGVASGTTGVEAAGDSNIWIYDLTGKTALRQLTFGGRNRFPVWSADGLHVTFQSDREGDFGIFWQRADGAAPAERLTKGDKGTQHIPESWSPDGKHLLFALTRAPSLTLSVLSLQDKKVTPFGDVQSSVTANTSATFSPDGKWVAYTWADGATRVESLVQPFPPTGAKYKVGDGIHPFWSRDGKELFFKGPPGRPLDRMSVSTQSGFALGNPEPVTGLNYRIRGPNVERENDILPDGRLVGVVDASAPTDAKPPAAQEIRIVLNWFEEVRQKATAK